MVVASVLMFDNNDYCKENNGQNHFSFCYVSNIFAADELL